MASSRPDVSIVIVVHNDLENLITSVGSAAHQTIENVEIVVVDDCSDDGSFEEAQRLASQDHRIRARRTEVNSGGPGAPRNIGIRSATAPWVMFLDSDDVLDPQAAEHLLAAARADDADIVCAQTQRLFVKDGDISGWHAELYSTRRHLSSIDEFSDLVIDTTATGKLYRREFLREHGLEFLEIHYEDLVFSAQAYSSATSISVIPECVYTWKVYEDEVRRSITNRRRDEANLEQRLMALRRVEDVVAGPGMEKLRERYQLKFLQHDARLYLRALADVPDDQAQRTLAMLEPRLRDIPEAVYSHLWGRERLLYGAALSGSVGGVRELALLLKGRVSLGGKTADVDGRVLWLPTAPLDRTPNAGELEYALLDVTDDPILSTPFPLIGYRHRVELIEPESSSCAVVRGVTADPFGKILPKLAQTRVRAVLENRETGTAFEFPVELRPAGEQQLRWEFHLEVPPHLPLVRSSLYSISLEIECGGSTNSSPILFDPDILPEKLVAPSGSLSAFLRQRFALFRTQLGRLGFTLIRTRGRRRYVENEMLRYADWTGSLPFRSERTVRMSTPWMRFAYRLMRVLPIHDDKAFFESQLGASLQDSPRRIAEALSTSRPDIRHVWAYAEKSPVRSSAARAVKRHTLAYLYELSTAKYLVANEFLPGYFRKRPGQVHLQTWHGVPLAAVGFDDPVPARSSESFRRDLERRVGYWDYLSVPSPYFERTFVPAYGFQGVQIRGGTPCNDPLVCHPECPADVVRSLDLPAGRRIVLYMPGLTSNGGRAHGPLSLGLSLDQWVTELGDDYFLLIRALGLTKLEIPRRYYSYCMDVSEYKDVSDLYRVSEALITDCSSAMFDYVVLDRPVLIYPSDCSPATPEHRRYFDLGQTPPGHICASQSALHEKLKEGADDPGGRRLRAEFKKAYCGEELGTSAATTVRTIWGS